MQTLEFLKEKVKNKLSSWDGKWFSQGGKEILVKSVAQCLPNYDRDIERSISRFWWGSNTGEKKGIHWMSWRRLSKYKSTWGMEFRDFKDFKDFNLALLEKQGWRLLSTPYNLVSHIYKARYFPNSNFLEVKLGYNRSIHLEKLVGSKRSCWRWCKVEGENKKRD